MKRPATGKKKPAGKMKRPTSTTKKPGAGNSKRGGRKKKTTSILHLLEDVSNSGGDNFSKNHPPKTKKMKNGNRFQPPAEENIKLELMVHQPEKPEKEKKHREPEPTFKNLKSKKDQAAKLENKAQNRKATRRIIFFVLPQLALLAFLVFAGSVFMNDLFFQGVWKGTITDENGKKVDIKLILNRNSNRIDGAAYIILPKGESILSISEKSSIPRVVDQVMSSEKGYILGSFDKEKAVFTLHPPKGKKNTYITFDGTFSSKDKLSGLLTNVFKSKGEFTLSRANNED